MLILLLLTGRSSFAQGSNDAWMETRAKIGFLAAHRSIMGHIPTEHAYALEVSYLMQTKGKRAWQRAYKYPIYGVTTFVGSVGNRELLGHYFGMYGFINFPFVARKHYIFSGKLGCGLAYTNKHYDPETNILGIAVSTSINAQICLALENRFTFGNHSISASLDMTHFSNGATKVPNLGLNLPYLSLGYGYRLRKATDTTHVHGDFKKRWELSATAIGSVKEIYPAGNRKYPIFGLNLAARRIFRPKTGMEVSLDVMYNESILSIHPDVPRRRDEIIQLGVFAGYILPLNRLHFVLGMGWYARDKFVQEENFYHRLGMRYILDNGLHFNLTLKSHWARADYVEYGIGYTFRK